MNRRNFLKNCCTGCLAFTAIPPLLESCRPVSAVTGNIIKDGLTLDASEFIMKDRGNLSYRSSVVVRNDKLLYPICVYRINENEYSAVWMKCSHQGAELQVAGDYLQCPAHGSEFNNKGIVTSGPASVNLRVFPVIVNKNELFIDLRKQI